MSATSDSAPPSATSSMDTAASSPYASSYASSATSATDELSALNERLGGLTIDPLQTAAANDLRMLLVIEALAIDRSKKAIDRPGNMPRCTWRRCRNDIIHNLKTRFLRDLLAEYLPGATLASLEAKLPPKRRDELPWHIDPAHWNNHAGDKTLARLQLVPKVMNLLFTHFVASDGSASADSPKANPLEDVNDYAKGRGHAVDSNFPDKQAIVGVFKQYGITVETPAERTLPSMGDPWKDACKLREPDFVGDFAAKTLPDVVARIEEYYSVWPCWHILLVALHMLPKLPADKRQSVQRVMEHPDYHALLRSDFEDQQVREWAEAAAAAAFAAASAAAPASSAAAPTGEGLSYILVDDDGHTPTFTALLKRLDEKAGTEVRRLLEHPVLVEMKNSISIFRRLRRVYAYHLSPPEQLVLDISPVASAGADANVGPAPPTPTECVAKICEIMDTVQRTWKPKALVGDWCLKIAGSNPTDLGSAAAGNLGLSREQQSGGKISGRRGPPGRGSRGGSRGRGRNGPGGGGRGRGSAAAGNFSPSMERQPGVEGSGRRGPSGRGSRGGSGGYGRNGPGGGGRGRGSAAAGNFSPSREEQPGAEGSGRRGPSGRGSRGGGGGYSRGNAPPQ